MNDGFYRPYLYVVLSNGTQRSRKVPMVVDTGADACYFDHNLAYGVGINPVDGGQLSSVKALNDSHTTAVYPVRIILPQLDDLSIDVEAEFTRIEGGWNGLLGHDGFFDRFERVSFMPRERCFELALPGVI